MGSINNTNPLTSSVNEFFVDILLLVDYPIGRYSGFETSQSFIKDGLEISVFEKKIKGNLIVYGTRLNPARLPTEKNAE